MNIIFLRKTLDWNTVTEENLLAKNQEIDNQHCIRLLKQGRLSNAIRNWNTTFSLNYFTFKEKIKALAANNLKEVKNINLFINKPEELPNTEFNLLPIDDDDWFHPDIFSFLLPQADVYYWPHTFINQNCNIKELKGIGRKIYTNNFAITNQGYEKLKSSQIDITRDYSIFSGGAINQLLKLNISSEFINRPLNVANKSPSSFSILMKVNNLIEYVKSFDKEVEVTSDLEWSQKLLDQRRKLIQELILSIR